MGLVQYPEANLTLRQYGPDGFAAQLFRGNEQHGRIAQSNPVYRLLALR